MKKFFPFLLFAAMLWGAARLVSGENYFWLTNYEQTRFGDFTIWMHGDTMWGPVRSNSTIPIMQDPVFYERVITTAPDFWRGTGYNPHFYGPRPVFRAPRYWPYQNTISCIRETAQRQGHYFDNPDMNYLCIFRGTQIVLVQWTRGTLLDYRNSTSFFIPMTPICLYFEGEVRVKGKVTGQVTLGSSKHIKIDDDIVYSDADSLSGLVPSSSHNLLALVAEGDVKISNTYENGRANSGITGDLPGYTQTDRRRTSVVIDAMIVALGESFTFDEQNDPDSGYVCDCQPDDRGTIYFYGCISQWRRGYFHRSTRNSTGYLKQLKYDERFQIMTPQCLWLADSLVSTDSLDFGDVVINTTRWDTAQIYTYGSYYLGLVNATQPFWADHVPGYGNHFAVPVSFTPTSANTFSGILTVGTPEEYHQIVLTGRGVRPPSLMTVSASPNPFNSVTTIRYTLPEMGAAQMTLYDVLGRMVKSFDLAGQNAGEHAMQWDASNIATGVYFLSLRAANHSAMQKLLLLK